MDQIYVFVDMKIGAPNGVQRRFYETTLVESSNHTEFQPDRERYTRSIGAVATANEIKKAHRYLSL